MKKQILAFLLCLSPSLVYAESLSMTTYIPVPRGSFSFLKIEPQAAGTITTNTNCMGYGVGTLGVDSTGTLLYCSNPNWGPIAGVWTKNGDNIYLSDQATPLLKKVGIGLGAVTTPEFKLTLDNDGGILAKGTWNANTTMTTTGAGTRFIWYPRRAAIRAGYVSGNQWDDTFFFPNVGDYSVAFGNSNKASGMSSAVLGGQNNTASAQYATVGGGGDSNAVNGNTATADYATVSGGKNNDAIGVASFVGGGDTNISGVGYYSTVSGGRYNKALGNYSTVGGGGDTGTPGNYAEGDFSTIAGGSANTAQGHYSSIAGGHHNIASGYHATIGGGGNNSTPGNQATADYTTVSGGNQNTATTAYATVGGGASNTASGKGATIAGGGWDTLVGAIVTNRASGDSTMIGGGADNIVGGRHSSILGGRVNRICENGPLVDPQQNCSNSVITGGEWNSIIPAPGAATPPQMAVIGGGQSNTAHGQYSTLAGGRSNIAWSQYSVISGGWDNHAGDITATRWSTVGGGRANRALGELSTISGGASNTISATSTYNTISGGTSNRIDLGASSGAIAGGSSNKINSGSYSTISGGSNNTIDSSNSWAGGQHMHLMSTSPRTFVWGFAGSEYQIPDSPDNFLIFPNSGGFGSTGNVGIGVSSPSAKLQVNGNVKINYIEPTGGDMGVYWNPVNKALQASQPFDVAEYFDASEEVEAGDVLVVDSTDNLKVRKSRGPYEKGVVGIASTLPAVLFEESQLHLAPQQAFIKGTKPPVALAGRIPCKVSLENGPIERGDLLTSSSIPGHAMKATDRDKAFGTIMGKALTPFNSGPNGETTGTVLVIVTLQ